MHYFVGWDVGGWNCDRNRTSRDALAVLVEAAPDKLALFGDIVRRNLRDEINVSADIRTFLRRACRLDVAEGDSVTIAIDTPLGLPAALVDLAVGRTIPDLVPKSYSDNPYLYRQTERWLFQKKHSPLSAIKDMIGSQATKGMHFIKKLCLTPADDTCGVWRGDGVTAIETYPAPCKGSSRLTAAFASLGSFKGQHEDKIDAVYCALIAWLFARDFENLAPPEDCPPPSEGWIWLPKDVLLDVAEKGEA